MKALFVNPSGEIYGSEQSMLALLQGAAFTSVVACPGSGTLAQQLRRDGISQRDVDFGGPPFRRNPLWHLSLFRRLILLLRSETPDVVIINLDGNTPLVTLAALWRSIPLARFCRFEFAPPARWIDRWCWRHVDAVICPSIAVREQLRQWLPLGANTPVHQIYDSCVDPLATAADITEFRSRFNLTGKAVVGCVGRLHPDKRVETVIRAHSQIQKHIPDAHLLVIGGAGSPHEARYEAELRALSNELNIGTSVTFTGRLPRTQLPAAYGAMDVCALASATESFGMVLTEAWRQGVPTVASDIGGCREISLASGGGLLAPVDDDTAFASQASRLLLDRSAASLMGTRGAAWVNRNCDPKASTQRLFGVLEAAIARHKP